MFHKFALQKHDIANRFIELYNHPRGDIQAWVSFLCHHIASYDIEDDAYTRLVRKLDTSTFTSRDLVNFILRHANPEKLGIWIKQYMPIWDMEPPFEMDFELTY